MRPFSSFTATSRRSSALAFLLLTAFFVYANTLLNGFVYDDHLQVERNPYVQNFHYIGRILTTTVWSFQGAEGQTNYYRPLMTLGFLLCNKAFQGLPYGFHLINILLNCVVVWLVFAVCSSLLGDEAVALTAAAMFALHPIHTEVVAWVAGVTELELAVLYLTAFALFLRLGTVQGRQRIVTYVLLFGAFVLALLSKEQAITLLLITVIYEHFYRADRAVTGWRTKMSRYSGLWVIGCAYLAFRAGVLGGFAPVHQHVDVTGPQAFLSSFALLSQHAAKLFWPYPPLVFHVFHKSASLTDAPVLLGMGAVVLGISLFTYLWKHARMYSFAVIWIFMTIVPVLNAQWMASNVFAERYLYLPSVGFCALVGGGAIFLYRKATAKATTLRWILVTMAIGVCAVAASRIIARNRDWKDDWALLNQTLTIEPHASLMRTDLGALEWDRGHHEEAERQWLQSLKDKPDNVVSLSNLGLAMLEKKRYDEAKRYLGLAIELRPRFASPHIHLGRVYLEEGDSGKAEAEFRKAVEIYPLSVLARNALGKFYLDNGKLVEAEQQYRASVESLPNDEGWSGLGTVYLRQKMAKKAEQAWRQASLLAPFDSRAHLVLGAVYVSDGRRGEAEKEYRDVLLVDPANSEARDALQKLGATNLPPDSAVRR